jgi:signal transduction histidine kinase
MEFQADGVSGVAYCEGQCDELIIKKDFHYYLTDQKNISQFEISITEPNCGLLKCLELDGKPPKDLVFQSKRNDTAWVIIYSGSAPVTAFPVVAGVDRKEPRGWDGGVTGLNLLDVNGDGVKDLLFTVGTCFDLQPRGLLAYDLKNNRELWHFWMGAFPRDVHLVDADRDGEKEIFMTSTAVGNGSCLNDFSDSFAYAAGFRRDGTLLWRRPLGGLFIDAVSWAGDLNGDGKPELVVALCEGKADAAEPNKILILDPQSGETEKFIQNGEKYMGMCVRDFNRDEKLEIATGNTDGTLRLYDKDLQLIMARNFGTRVDLVGAADLNGDGTVEILIAQPDNRLVILDENLQTLCLHAAAAGEKLSVDFIRDHWQKKLLVHYGSAPPFAYALMSFSGQTFFGRVVGTRLNLWFLLCAVIFIVAVSIHAYYTQKMRALNLRNEHAAKVMEWSWLARRLAHEIKNPLSTVNLTLQRIQEVSRKKFGKEAKVLEDYADSILEEVERIRETTDKFMRILSFSQPNLTPADVNAIVEKVLKKYEPSLPKGIRLEKTLAPDLPFVQCDETQIQAALSNILENAIDAVAGKGTVSVATIPVEIFPNGKDRLRPTSGIAKCVEIRIEDTGPGIAQANMVNIFKPFYTTKSGGSGIGLVIAKRIVDSHHGRIDVTSQVGIGTVFKVQLPV